MLSLNRYPLRVISHNSRTILSSKRLVSSTSILLQQQAKSTQSKKNKESPLYDTLKRGTKWTISSSIVLVALGLSSISIYLVFSELFSPSGETSTFNRVVSQIEDSKEALKLLGYSDEEIEENNSFKKIRLKAYGQEPSDKWSRNRPVTATKFTGKDGKEHMLMRFFVESESKVGVVQLEAIEENFIQQELLYVSLDVKGSPRFYLIGGPKLSSVQKKYNLLNGGSGFLGVNWGPKKD
ncbi:hypothetical protein CANARDRAFT_30167 [[Candida] arabinofermentans NRRL YB-2248]|uniref:Mitochondrial import inner membrane translocase subunit Tim21 n=1 Tax=[Candida] arabinofermentans NRRL YB-2248 TaxID=983967 RepID=A0A1E4SUP8_9ASCO|nr:hypothetical protein CANARDRAFT_30167 [[Candida] arabinofermentans NRRL YB-2248]